MITELPSQVHGAPIFLIHFESNETDWIGLAHRNERGLLSLCFWSSREEKRVSASDLLQEIATDVAGAQSEGAVKQRRDALWDVGYKQPLGWDRWGRPGVPNPIRGVFDETLHPALKSRLGI